MIDLGKKVWFRVFHVCEENEAENPKELLDKILLSMEASMKESEENSESVWRKPYVDTDTNEQGENFSLPN